ncbi:MAG: sugar ABC transporter substrate-binding protein [Oscillospiraceae bacterium]|jgi:inositol transport system substrate-binding protein
MKKLLSALVAAAMLLTLAACGDSEGSSSIGTTTKASGGSADSSASNEAYKVVYIARTLSDPFAAWLADEMKSQSEAYADTFTLDVLDAQGDNEKSNSLIETAITQKYDCIILQSNDGEFQRPYAEQAIEEGIKVVAVNPQIPGLEGASQIDADPYIQGTVLAQDAIERVPENGKVVVMSAIPGNLHTTKRYEAYMDIFFEARPYCELVAEIILERVSEADAMATFEDWVQSYGDIDCVLTSADVLALACLEVVKDNPTYDNMLAYGVDGLPSSMIAVKKGTYTGSCLQNATEIAEKSLKAAYEMLVNDKVVNDTVDAILVNSDNVDEYIDMYIERGMLKKSDFE